MQHSRCLRFARTALGWLLMSAVASAGTFKVSSGDAADLQAAIDDAAPGDTISLSGGPYVGNFTIPPGKDGLVIKGKVTIEAQGRDYAFLLDSPDLRFIGLTIRHSGDEGISGPSGGTLAGLTISKCTFLGCGDYAVRVTGDDVSISSCEVRGCEGGFRVTGDRASIMKSSVSSSSGTAVNVTGNDARVRKIEARLVQGGVMVNGAGAIVTKCRLAGVTGGALVVTGADAVASDNDIDGAQQGMVVSGADALVSGNRLRGTHIQGIFAGGAGAVIERNDISRGLSSGIEVFSLDGGAVEDNRIEDMAGYGLRIGSSGAFVAGNRVASCGMNSYPGLTIEGDSNVVEKNVVEACEWTGIMVAGSLNELTGNTATRNGDNGILIPSVSDEANALAGNKATSNGGEGLQNGGLGTVIQANVFTKNQLDLSNETADGATLVDNGGNVFKTGGLTTEPAVDRAEAVRFDEGPSRSRVIWSKACGSPPSGTPVRRFRYTIPAAPVPGSRS